MADTIFMNETKTDERFWSQVLNVLIRSGEADLVRELMLRGVDVQKEHVLTLVDGDTNRLSLLNLIAPAYYQEYSESDDNEENHTLSDIEFDTDDEEEHEESDRKFLLNIDCKMGRPSLDDDDFSDNDRCVPNSV